jgi:hypothetical protein
LDFGPIRSYPGNYLLFLTRIIAIGDKNLSKGKYFGKTKKSHTSPPPSIHPLFIQKFQSAKFKKEKTPLSSLGLPLLILLIP